MRLAAAILLTLSCLGASTPAHANEFVVVVHADNPVTTIGETRLRQIFRGDRQYWEHGKRIVILLPASGTPEMEYLVEQVFGMEKESQLHRYYTASIFQQKFSRAPHMVSVADALTEIAGSKNAVAIVGREGAKDASGIKTIEIGEK